MSSEFEEFIDDAIDADFEYDDIVRVSKLLDAGEGIDHLDSEKLIPDFCSLRYKYIFMYMSFSVIHYITRPKKNYDESIRHLRKAGGLLGTLVHEMKRIKKEIDNIEPEDGNESG